MPKGFGIEPLTPAYGRDYKTLKEAQESWDSGKDFQTAGGQYCSKRDFNPDDFPLRVRFAKLRKTGFLK